MKHVLPVLVMFTVAGCAQVALTPERPDGALVEAAMPADGLGGVRPQMRPADLDTTSLISAPPPPAAARTVEEFDTTSAAERAEAAAAPEPVGEQKLGSTVASLGDVAEPGFWLKTPLVKAQMQGRVTFPATGKSAQVELLPLDGPTTAGSRISLAAMRLIGAPITDLPTIEVYSGG